MRRDVGKAQLALAFLRPHLAEAEQPRQPAIAVAVDRISEQARRIGQVEPAADQRPQPRARAGAVHPHHAGQRVAVGDADRVMPSCKRRQHQLDRVRRSAQEGERRADAKLDIRRRRRSAAAACRSRPHQLQPRKAGSSRASAEQPVDEPVGQRRRGRRRSGLRGRSSSGGRPRPRPDNNRAAAPIDGCRHHSGAIRSGPSTRAMSCTARRHTNRRGMPSGVA